MKEEQILIRITGQDRPGLTAAVMGILAKYDAQILDIGQADIHSTLSLGILMILQRRPLIVTTSPTVSYKYSLKPPDSKKFL